MPQINVEIEVYCSCGEGLCNSTSTKNTRLGEALVVEPCSSCIAHADEQGYDRGYNQAEIDNDL